MIPNFHLIVAADVEGRESERESKRTPWLECRVAIHAQNSIYIMIEALRRWISRRVWLKCHRWRHTSIMTSPPRIHSQISWITAWNFRLPRNRLWRHLEITKKMKWIVGVPGRQRFEPNWIVKSGFELFRFEKTFLLEINRTKPNRLKPEIKIKPNRYKSNRFKPVWFDLLLNFFLVRFLNIFCKQ